MYKSHIIGSLVLVLLATTTLLDTGGDARTGGGGSALNGIIQFGFVGAGIIMLLRTILVPSNIIMQSPSAAISCSFAIWAALTTLWSPSPLLTFEKSLQLGLFIVAAALIAYSLRDQQDTATIMAISFMIFIAILIGINILVWHRPFPMVAGGLPDDEPGFAQARVRLVLARMHPVGAGHMLAAAAICTALAKLPMFIRLACCLLMILGVWMADVRTAIVSLILVAGLVMIKRVSANIRSIIGIIGIVVALFMVCIYLDDEFTTTIKYITTDPDVSTFDGRTEVWEHVIHLIQNYWVKGVGFYASRHYIMYHIDWGATHAHNSFLDTALCTGIIGAAIFIIFVGYMLWVAWHSADDHFLLGIIIYTILLGSLETEIFSPTLPMFVLAVVMAHYDYRVRYHQSHLIREIER